VHRVFNEKQPGVRECSVPRMMERKGRKKNRKRKKTLKKPERKKRKQNTQSIVRVLTVIHCRGVAKVSWFIASTKLKKAAKKIKSVRYDDD